MQWEEALEIFLDYTNHQQMRLMCQESHPDHFRYRLLVVDLARRLESGPRTPVLSPSPPLPPPVPAGPRSAIRPPPPGHRPPPPSIVSEADRHQNVIREAVRQYELRRNIRLVTLARKCPYRVMPCSCNLGYCTVGRSSDLTGGNKLYPGDCFRCLDPVTPPKFTDRELVVARYRENLDWLAALDCPTIVYNKGPEVVLPTRFAREVRLPKVGREAHTILYHIVANYDNLADTTFFVQGYPFDHALDVLDRLKLEYPEPESLTRHYKVDFPGQAARQKDRVVHRGNRESRYGDSNYFGTGGNQTKNRQWTERVWSEVFACPCPAPLYYGYGAMWAVPRSCLLARPLSLWRGLLERLSGPEGASTNDRDPDHILTPWALELLWGYLFDDPGRYPTKPELEIM